MIRVEEATCESVKFFDYDGIEKEVLDKLNWRERLKYYCTVGRAWQVMNESKSPIMLFGVYECSPGVLQAWMLLNKSAAFYKKSIVEIMREAATREMKTYHRLQTYVLMGDQSGKLLEMVGFKYETRLACFGPNKEDAKIYAMVNQ